MKATVILHQSNKLIVEFKVSNNSFVSEISGFSPSKSPSVLSEKYNIGDSTKCQIKIIQAIHKESNNVHRYNNHQSTTTINNNMIFISYTRAKKDDKINYVMKLSSNKFELVENSFMCDDTTWRLIHIYESTNSTYDFKFDIIINTEIVSLQSLPNGGPFAVLYEDETLIDFELRGEDGAIDVHKTVLATASPVLRTMLAGTWKETSEGYVDVPGISQATLTLFKDYIYLHKLPNFNQKLEQLILLASFYMMPDLEQICVDKMVNSMNTQNACDLLEFAVKHKVRRLMLAILSCVQSGSIDVMEMQRIFLISEFQKLNNDGNDGQLSDVDQNSSDSKKILKVNYTLPSASEATFTIGSG